MLNWTCYPYNLASRTLFVISKPPEIIFCSSCISCWYCCMHRSSQPPSSTLHPYSNFGKCVYWVSPENEKGLRSVQGNQALLGSALTFDNSFSFARKQSQADFCHAVVILTSGPNKVHTKKRALELGVRYRCQVIVSPSPVTDVLFDGVASSSR